MWEARLHFVVVTKYLTGQLTGRKYHFDSFSEGIGHHAVLRRCDRDLTEAGTRRGDYIGTAGKYSFCKKNYKKLSWHTVRHFCNCLCCLSVAVVNDCERNRVTLKSLSSEPLQKNFARSLQSITCPKQEPPGWAVTTAHHGNLQQKKW